MDEKISRFLTAKNFVRLIGIFVTASMLLVSGILFWIPASQKARCTQNVTATVTGFHIHDGDSGETYAPVFEYTYNDMKYRSSSNVYANPPEFEEGETAEICINPNDPYDVYVPTDKTMFIVAGVIFAWAVVVFVFLELIFPAMLKIKPKEQLVSYTEDKSDNF